MFARAAPMKTHRSRTFRRGNDDRFDLGIEMSQRHGVFTFQLGLQSEFVLLLTSNSTGFRHILGYEINDPIGNDCHSSTRTCDTHMNMIECICQST